MSDNNPRRLESLEVNEAEDGLVIYDPATDMVHHLNPSAAVIFDLCDGTRDPDAIARLLAEAYDLQSPPIAQAIAGLRELADRHLIRWDAQQRER
jgi:Coenzyme PQQ synthesis protein D (PqqD)